MSKTSTLSLLITFKILVLFLLNHLWFQELELLLFSLLEETLPLEKLLNKLNKEMSQLICKTNLLLLLIKLVTLVLVALSLHSAQWLSELPWKWLMSFHVDVEIFSLAKSHQLVHVTNQISN